jgi:hypothetical protein
LRRRGLRVLCAPNVNGVRTRGSSAPRTRTGTIWANGTGIAYPVGLRVTTT